MWGANVFWIIKRNENNKFVNILVSNRTIAADCINMSNTKSILFNI